MSRTILVIADTPSLGEIVTEVADGEGGSALLAPDLKSADDLVEAVKVDWITLDLGVAGGNGARWLAELARTRPELARRTLVIMEPPYRRDVAESLEQLGASVLMKPLRAERLRIELGDVMPSA